MNEHLFQIIDNPIALTYVGAICGHILSLYSEGFKGSVPFLSKVFPNKSDAFYFRLDFLLLPIIGAMLGCILLEPEGLRPAIFAGLSWSGTLTALLKKGIGPSTN